MNHVNSQPDYCWKHLAMDSSNLIAVNTQHNHDKNNCLAMNSCSTKCKMYFQASAILCVQFLMIAKIARQTK